MKKINLIKRLFWSSQKINNFILDGDSEPTENVELIQANTKLEANEALLKAKEETIKELQDYKNEKIAELETLRRDNQKLSAAKTADDARLAQSTIKTKADEAKIEALKAEITQSKTNAEHLRTNINEKLRPLQRIEKTFFAQAGNKGKGELGEMRLEVQLEKAGFENSFWVKNLKAGNTSESVEFAIKSGVEGIYIPVDSKVLDAKFDDEEKMIIDEEYAARVKQQAKIVSKYLGKSNTANYGMLVLQNDEIYMELFNKFPTLFADIINEHKIYISSPSSFIQFAWSISNILKIYEKIHGDEKIYDDMLDMLVSVTKMGNSLAKVQSNFNIAMNTHYPTVQTRQAKLVRKLKKNDKIKELPEIGVK